MPWSAPESCVAAIRSRSIATFICSAIRRKLRQKSRSELDKPNMLGQVSQGYLTCERDKCIMSIRQRIELARIDAMSAISDYQTHDNVSVGL